MSFDADIKHIKKLTHMLFSKDVDVYLIYRGTNHGVTKPWVIKCDNRENFHETYEGAAKELLNALKKELKAKIESLEGETNKLKNAFATMDN